MKSLAYSVGQKLASIKLLNKMPRWDALKAITGKARPEGVRSIEQIMQAKKAKPPSLRGPKEKGDVSRPFDFLKDY